MKNERAGCEVCDGVRPIGLFFTPKHWLQIKVESGELKASALSKSMHREIGRSKVSFCPNCGCPFNLCPMTLEEAVAYGRPVVREVRQPDDGSKCYWVLPHELQTYWDFPPARYWEQIPTLEQSAAWPWREEEGKQ